MDPLIQILNQNVTEKVAKENRPEVVKPQTGQSFSEVLDDKRGDMALRKMTAEIAGDGPELRVQSASDIELRRVDFQEGAKTNLDPKQKLLDLFSNLNEDMVSLDASIEVLSDPNIKLNRRQLLAYQAGIGHMTINTELFSKMAQTVSQNLTTLLNTNVG